MKRLYFTIAPRYRRDLDGCIERCSTGPTTIGEGWVSPETHAAVVERARKAEAACAAMRAAIDAFQEGTECMCCGSFPWCSHDTDRPHHLSDRMRTALSSTTIGEGWVSPEAHAAGIEQARQTIVRDLIDEVGRIRRENVPALAQHAGAEKEARARDLACLLIREALHAARLGDMLPARDELTEAHAAVVRERDELRAHDVAGVFCTKHAELVRIFRDGHCPACDLEAERAHADALAEGLRNIDTVGTVSGSPLAKLARALIATHAARRGKS